MNLLLLRNYSRFPFSSFFQSSTKQTKPNHYQLLGVNAQFTQKQLRSKFLEKARKLHPDHNKSPQAHDLFKQVKQAYQTLKDPRKKYLYDSGLSRGSGGQDQNSSGHYNATTDHQSYSQPAHQFKFYGGFHGNSNKWASRYEQTYGQPKPQQTLIWKIYARFALNWKQAYWDMRDQYKATRYSRASHAKGNQSVLECNLEKYCQQQQLNLLWNI